MLTEFPNPMSKRARISPPHRAFSLIELIAVIAIIAIMMGLLAPTLSNFGSTLGRKAAVTTLMNTFEQARVAALEAGSEVTVILRRRPFPEQDSLMVVRERLQWDNLPGTGPIQLTKWIELPEKVLLYSKSSIIENSDKENVPLNKLPSGSSFEPPGLDKSRDKLSYVTFSPRATVIFPKVGKDSLTLFVTEGARADDFSEVRISENGTPPLERIALARYTGRARLDITSLSDTSSELEATR